MRSLGLLVLIALATFLCQAEAKEASHAKAITDHCKPNPCSNGATCLERVDGFVCMCSNNFTGIHCDILDYCQSTPCLHGGRCLDTKTSYSCDCTGTGYDGYICHVPYDDCKSHPCLHGATCVDGFKNFTCNCLPGFAGKTCDVELSACVSQPCQHGGTCIDTHAGTNPGHQRPGFRCQCVEGLSGTRCEINYNDCWVKPCGRGVCIDGINSFTCDCSNSGYSGPRCEHKNMNKCLLNPCQNGATCVQDIDDYHCVCPAFKEGLVTHGGKNCSVLLRGCEDVHSCRNGAVCVPILLNEAANVHGYQCSCAHGFMGRVCDTITTMTISNDTYIRKTYTSDYTLDLRFRTATGDGVLLYDRDGQSFTSVELVNGSIYLVSGNTTGVTEAMEILTNAQLHDSVWHTLRLTSNSLNNTLTITDPLCISTDVCSVSVSRSNSRTSFKEIFIGAVTVKHWFQETFSQRNFEGCIQDVVFKGEVILPSNFGVAEFHQIKMDCAACLPNACDRGYICKANSTIPNGHECYCPYPLFENVCVLDEGTSCNFDSGLCGWHQDTNDNFDWTRYQGNTPTLSTGPSGDHTTGSGYYMYIESSGHSYSTARLYSNWIKIEKTSCFRIYLNMYGSYIRYMYVYQNNNGRRSQLIYMSGNQNQRWFYRTATVSASSHTRFEIEGYTGSGDRGDIAIDDVSLVPHSC